MPEGSREALEEIRQEEWKDEIERQLDRIVQAVQQAKDLLWKKQLIYKNMTSDQTRGTTFGEKAVGLTFNPGGDPLVDKVKRLYAEIIDLCNDPQQDGGATAMNGEEYDCLKLLSPKLRERRCGQ